MTSPIRRGAPNSVDAPIQTKNAEHAALTTLVRAEQMLESARNLDDIKKIIDIAEAARVWFRAAKLGESAAQHADEIKLWAQRKAGEFLRQLERGKAGQPKKNCTQAEYNSSPFRQAVEDAGLEKNEVRRFQLVAAVLESEFLAYLEEKKKAGGEITQAELLRTARASQRQEHKAAIAEQIRSEPRPTPEGPFRVIVLDPPWRYSARADDPTHRARNPYPDMDLEEIKALPVAALAHTDSIIWLWTTNAFMREAFDCIDAWGFEVKTILTWMKDKMGLGDWLRGRTEHCIMAVRGKPVVTLTNQTTALEAPVGKHSAKPDKFFELVESLCPGSKLEMFARGTRGEWTKWGAEAR